MANIMRQLQPLTARTLLELPLSKAHFQSSWSFKIGTDIGEEFSIAKNFFTWAIVALMQTSLT